MRGLNNAGPRTGGSRFGNDFKIKHFLVYGHLPLATGLWPPPRWKLANGFLFYVSGFKVFEFWPLIFDGGLFNSLK